MPIKDSQNKLMLLAMQLKPKKYCAIVFSIRDR